MTLTLRHRIFLTLVPLLALLGVLGGAGVVLLYRLGGSIDLILRENYDSVIAMERLNEALERIDSSFQFALAGEEEKARRQYQDNWAAFEPQLEVEEKNITIHPVEDDLVANLRELTRRYHSQGNEFYARPAAAAERHRLYFGGPDRAGLLRTFEEIKHVAGEISRINHENMIDASRESRQLATDSLLWFAGGLGAAVVLAVLLSLYTTRTLLQPIRAITESARAIGLGNLDQVVAVPSRDELGQLAAAFNTMGRQLRQYRKTDYARLLRAQRTSQATIDSFPDPVLVVDSESRVEMANPAARRLLGVVPRGAEEEAGLAWQPPEPLRGPLTEALQKQHDFLPEGFDRAVPLRYDGQECFFLPRILSIHDPYGNTLGAAIVLQNVTRFQLLDQMKGNLVATVSHELKTPLTSIRLAVHLLLEEATGPLAPKQTELLVDARDNAERLLATINNLLDLTRLERSQGHLTTRPESPATLLHAAAESIRPRAEDKHLEVKVEAPAELALVAVDAERFGHALNNLLDNAVAYTNRGGRITLSAARLGDIIELKVADTGRGIPAEHLPHVFERFFRVPGQNEGAGTGLGLAIVQEIVTAHGGTIRCESQPGQGTVFRIQLPISSPRGPS
jgi:two-component system, NtrC family, sensor histidine kinase KinB